MWDNFKWFLKDDTAYYGLIIGFVAISSFGLGRLSVEPTTVQSPNGPSVNKAAVAEAALPLIKDLATSAPTVVLPVVDSSQTVYIGSKNSDKYHLPWCSGAKRIAEANKVFFKSKQEAEAAGYTPAANCKGI